MPKHSPQTIARVKKDFSSLGAAIKNKLSDFGASKMVVDNKANPASAYSMMMRKTKSKGQPTNFPK